MRAEDGGRIVQQTVGAMAEINSSSTRMSDIIGVIDEIAFQTHLLALNAAASEEQAAGVEQVTNAVTQMDTVTREIAALVEEAASAAKSLESQAHSLSQQIAYFRTGDRQAERALPQTAAVTARVAAPQVSEESVLPLALAS